MEWWMRRLKVAASWLATRRRGVAVIILTLTATGVLAWILGPGAAHLIGVDDRSTLSGKDLASAVDAVRGRVLQICAGLLAAGALIYTARNHALSSEGQVTERYSKAIAHLGSDKPNERVGGIYALERVMTDSARDHVTVVEVLCAFIREQTALDPEASWVDPTPDATRRRHGDAPRLATDVQAALTVLGRRPKRNESGRLNLRRCDLSGAVLADGRFDHADFSFSALRYVGAACSSMRRANFFRAELQYATLGDDLRDANFASAKLHGANLASSDVTGASFGRADLKGTYFYVFGWQGEERAGFDCKGLTEEQIKHSQWDSSTAWPSYLTPDPNRSLPDSRM
jgi:hypothetical protein